MNWKIIVQLSMFGLAVDVIRRCPFGQPGLLLPENAEILRNATHNNPGLISLGFVGTTGDALQ